MQRIALGTVQFGLSYGIANRQGQPYLNEVAKILAVARQSGMDTLDTAIAYGDSEQRLGAIGVQDWQVVSKLPALSELSTSVTKWTKGSVISSLERLKIDSLYGILLHQPDDLMSPQGEEVYNALLSLKKEQLVQKIGISVYHPAQLDALCSRFSFDLVQAPLNVLDQQLIHSGWLAKLTTQNIEVHVRSIFLQGLLLMDEQTRPKKFRRWSHLWKTWHNWLQQNNLTPLQACLGFALAQPQISHVLVGVDSVDQLKEILTFADSLKTPIPNLLSTTDLDLINPSRWQTL
ncbi:MAG: aldo/keto reductase [Leptolyngbyaceae cyanobacterium]